MFWDEVHLWKSPSLNNTYILPFQKGQLFFYISVHIGGTDAVHFFLFLSEMTTPSPQKTN